MTMRQENTPVSSVKQTSKDGNMNIIDVDLNSPDTIRDLLPVLPYMEELAPEYPGVRTVRMDLEEKIKRANLSHDEITFIKGKLIDGMTYDELKEVMNLGRRWQKNVIQGAIDRIARS